MGKLIFRALLISILILLALFAIYVIVMVISGIPVDLSKDCMRDSAYYRALLDIGVKIAIIGAGIHLSIEGLEEVPKDGRFLIVSNHRSKFDPIVTWFVLRKNKLAFISKPENFKVPFYGKIIRRCCCLPIDREDPIVVMTVDGTELISRNFPFHTTTVTFKVAETIPAEEVKAMRSKEIGDRVYRDFVRNLAHEEHMDEQAMCYN